MFRSKCNQEVADGVPLVDGRVSEPCGFKRVIQIKDTLFELTMNGNEKEHILSNLMVTDVVNNRY